MTGEAGLGGVGWDGNGTGTGIGKIPLLGFGMETDGLGGTWEGSIRKGELRGDFFESFIIALFIEFEFHRPMFMLSASRG